MLKFSTEIYSKTFESHEKKKSQNWFQDIAPEDLVVEELLISLDNEVPLLEIGIQPGGSIKIWQKSLDLMREWLASISTENVPTWIYLWKST
jgi:hypothetical protein